MSEKKEAPAFEMPPLPKIDYPITPRENMIRLLDKRDPVYMPTTWMECQGVFPNTFYDAQNPPFEDGYDGFGVHWTYDAAAKGSVVTVGTKAIKDLTNWQQELKLPNLDEYDYNLDPVIERLDPNKFTTSLIGHGFFERLHHLGGFEDALVALQIYRDDIAELFDVLLEHKIDHIKRMIKASHGKIDAFTHSDDMGTQLNTFFSNEIYEELFYPRVKKLADFVHGEGFYFFMHSCGKQGNFVQYYADIGVDLWETQALDDMDDISDKYGDKIVLQMGMPGAALKKPDATKEEIIECVHNFVDRGARHKNFINMTIPEDPRVAEIVLPEVVRYSTEVYAANK